MQFTILDTEEDASKLKFGKAGEIFFSHENTNGNYVPDTDSPYLTNEELYAILVKDSPGNNDVLDMTRRYLESVTCTRTKEDIETMSAEVRAQLKNAELMVHASGELARLHEYEMSALSNLVKVDGATAEEVIAWIPSLVRFDEEDIDKVIRTVVDAKTRIGHV